ADLDDRLFEVRARAARKLHELGESAGPALRQALAGRPSVEVRRRLEGLLDKVQKAVLPSHQLRGVRAIEVLESIGTPEARQVLERVAGGAPNVLLTQEAAAALRRLRKLPPAPIDIAPPATREDESEEEAILALDQELGATIERGEALGRPVKVILESF